MKKIPIRKCMGCNAQKEKTELVRIVHSPDGEISVESAKGVGTAFTVRIKR